MQPDQGPYRKSVNRLKEDRELPHRSTPIRVAVRVIDTLTRDSIRVVVGPGMGMLDGGSEQTWPLSKVPTDLRSPNTEFWLVKDVEGGKFRIERMTDPEQRGR